MMEVTIDAVGSLGLSFTHHPTAPAAVATVAEGSPAALAGVRAGMVLTAVQGEGVDGMGCSAALDVLRGAATQRPLTLAFDWRSNKAVLILPEPEPDPEPAAGGLRAAATGDELLETLESMWTRVLTAALPEAGAGLEWPSRRGVRAAVLDAEQAALLFDSPRDSSVEPQVYRGFGHKIVALCYRASTS
jgi:hypothetical protein